MPATAHPTVDPQVFRDVMGHYPTGVAVVTGRDIDDEMLAMVVGTFSSVSLDPPLVSFMPMKTSRTFAKMRKCSSLCINILAGEQEDTMLTIVRRWDDKLDGIDWFPSPSGDPVLSESIAWIDTSIHDIVEAGDHWIVLCAVHDMSVTNPVSPLIFFQGGYGNFVCTSLMARMDHHIMPAIHAVHGVREDVESLARTIAGEVSLLTAVNSDEMVTVLTESAEHIDRQQGLAHRIPMMPPIGDTYVCDKTPDHQEQWIGKLRDASDEIKEMHRERVNFLREHGYAVSFLPTEDSGDRAYKQLRTATKQYESGRLTPAQERDIRRSITTSPIDYRTRQLDDSVTYDIASIVLPVRASNGNPPLTLRLAQLPAAADGTQVREWICLARRLVDKLEADARVTAKS